MQVDDKLAKERLARELEEFAQDAGLVFYVHMIKRCAQLIRNTDLTDCQPQKAMNEHSSGTRAEVPPSATDSGTQ